MGYQVRVTGFNDEADAERYADEQTEAFGYSTFVEISEDED